MKTLYLLRHAEAESVFGVEDKQRALTAKGQADAVALGRLMSERGHIPQKILCSPAVRTRQTLIGINDTLSQIDTKSGVAQPIPVDYPAFLYGASAGELFKTIQDVAPDISSVLIIAHNPGIHEIAARLADDAGQQFIGLSYPPCTLCVFDCPVDNWAGIGLGDNALRDIICL